MKKTLKLFTLLILLIIVGNSVKTFAKNDKHINSLMEIDEELRKYFPRWKICEPDLQFKIYQSFMVLGYDKSELNQQNIQVMAAPFDKKNDKGYDILTLSCGNESMNARTLARDMSMITRILSGRKNYKSDSKNKNRPLRDYCSSDIPAEIPVKESEAEMIADYMKHDNKSQYISMSLFEQSLKIGETGSWIIAKTGNDEIGYPFWQAGESKIALKTPLYQNTNSESKQVYKNLLNVYLGATYKTNSGIGDEGLFGWLGDRKLNSHAKGKLNFGFDYHLPVHPDFGLNFNLEIPLQNIGNELVDQRDFGTIGLPSENTGRIIEFKENGYEHRDALLYSTDPDKANPASLAYVLGTTGQVTFFYNYWLDKSNPENFFQFKLGVSYNEVQEFVLYQERDTSSTNGGGGNGKGNGRFHLDKENFNNLNYIKNDEFMDWLYAKIEYRSQGVWPFSVSAQVSNQILLAKAYMPLFGNWFYLEAKYAMPLRDALPYERETFFIISPVIRIAI